MQLDQKVINLFRDPRGMISSRMKIEQVRNNQSDTRFFRNKGHRLREVKKAADKACQDIKGNLQLLQRLSNQLPDFSRLYYAVRYEDFAEDPITTAKELYRSLPAEPRFILHLIVWHSVLSL